ncbi:glycoside hydrolase family 5 protein [Pelagicoccus albus]|uniref:Cellulase family glycosylhydrolase n=1 Tax=Pelagicoccus albus TaxID=415222 RepID=A0A7X1B744_9BACT|nr:cellulase family glycosylhydrolase [Pelagicoccus albus]MBC2606624.1 cellulase family glycosylhydrolase [Pelagicoccus albus]
MPNAPQLPRRDFIKNTALGVAGATLASSMLPQLAFSEKAKLAPMTVPKWKGFNFLDFFVPDPARSRKKTTEDHFRWMSDWGFDFVRIPMAYPYYLDIDYERDITPDEVYKISEKKVAEVDRLVEMANKHGLHVSLNLHRAPGYCINAGFHEPYNLWKDDEALEAFCYHWEMWAKRYKGISRELISFDLVNEPSMREDMNDQFGKREAVPGMTYRRVAGAAVKRIRSVAPDHLIMADGNNGGHEAVPELIDLGVGQSCRGYFPFEISHHRAPWVHKDPSGIPAPSWPNGPEQDRAGLEEFYQPWFDLQDAGVGVHCGECGCYKETPHDVFLAWFGDVLGVLSERGIGFSLWEMDGDFGILNSGRDDVAYEDWHGQKLDRKLLKLLQSV